MKILISLAILSTLMFAEIRKPTLIEAESSDFLICYGDGSSQKITRFQLIKQQSRNYIIDLDFNSVFWLKKCTGFINSEIIYSRKYS